jgi:hypothetical protein
MPSKLSVVEVTEMMEKRFAEFKAGLLEDLSKDIQTFVDERKQELNQEVTIFFEEKSEEISKFGELANSIAAIQEHVKKLEVNQNTLRKENKNLSERIENLEQYGRRCNIRIYGIPLQNNETSVNVRNKVLKIKSDANMDIPDYAIDRAHRVGKVITKDGERKQAVIVRFTSFYARTIFYRARKTLNIGVSLDLTHERLNLLKEAREKLANDNIVGIKFAYADINCSLRVLTETGKHIVFKSLKDLDELISDL